MSAAAPTGRRRFQFSLTSLFLLTTLVAIWLAWELAFIRQRQAWLRENPALVDPDAIQVPLASIQLSPGTAGGAGTSSGTFAITASPTSPSREAFIPWWRMLLGDEPVATIVDTDLTDEDRARAVRLFPEAELVKPPAVGNLLIGNATVTIIGNGTATIGAGGPGAAPVSESADTGASPPE